MSDSLFENLLKKKAASFQPPVSAKVLAGVKLGASAGAKAAVASGKVAAIKSVTAKLASTVASKSIIGVVSVAVVGTGTVLISQSNDDDQLQTNAAANTEKVIYVDNDLQERSVAFSPINNDLGNFPLMAMNTKTHEKSNDGAGSETTGTDMETQALATDITKEERITKPEEHEDIKPNVFATVEDTEQETDIELSLHSINFNPLMNDRDDQMVYIPISKPKAIPKRRKSPGRFSLRTNLSLAKSKILDRESISSAQEESFSGSMMGGGLGLYYELNNFCNIGLWNEYQKIEMTSKYTTNGKADGKIKRDLQVYLLKAGAEFNILRIKQWDFNAELQAGMAYKLKHNNQFSGKYLQKAISKDMKKENQMSPALDLNLKVNRELGRRFELGTEIFSNYLHFNKDFKILNTGARFVVIYKL
jgi:hypothetical protein